MSDSFGVEPSGFVDRRTTLSIRSVLVVYRAGGRLIQ
jgi:hypothetical protein